MKTAILLIRHDPELFVACAGGAAVAIAIYGTAGFGLAKLVGRLF